MTSKRAELYNAPQTTLHNDAASNFAMTRGPGGS